MNGNPVQPSSTSAKSFFDVIHSLHGKVSEFGRWFFQSKGFALVRSHPYLASATGIASFGVILYFKGIRGEFFIQLVRKATGHTQLETQTCLIKEIYKQNLEIKNAFEGLKEEFWMTEPSNGYSFEGDPFDEMTQGNDTQNQTISHQNSDTTEIQELEKKVKALEEQLGSKQESSEYWERQYEGLKKEHTALKEQLESNALGSQAISIKTEETKDNQIQKLHQQIEDLTQSNCHLMNSVQKDILDSQKLTSDLEKEIKKNKLLEAQLGQLQENYDELMAKSNHIESSDLTNQNFVGVDQEMDLNLLQQIESLTARNDMLQKAFENEKNQNQRLKNQLKDENKGN